MAQCPPPPGGKERRPAWSNPGLYSGIRLGWTWPHAFEVFRTSEHVSDEALWLMVCGFRTQGVRLLHHPQTRHHNRRLLETIGLATVEVLLPELRFAEALGVAGREKAIAAAEYQFYPDGHHLELAPNYTAMCLANLYAVAGRHRADGGEWPHRYLDRLATIGNALCRIAAPDGWTPALHDSQRNDCREMYQSLTAFLGEARMGEPAWRSGENDLLPWGGYGVLRRDGLYALLDGGAGQFDGHSHHDTMQVITFAHGRWFTIDPGKPRYGGGDMMRHLRSSRAHNVVTIDGRNRRPITPIIDEPVPLALVSKGPISVTATARRFTTDVREDRGGDGGPTVRFDHERVLINLADLGWLVFDRLTPLDQEPHAWRWAWHFPTDRVELSGDDSALAVYDGGPTMRVQTVASRSLKRRVCEGQTEPQLCGWRSEGESNRPVPAPALVALAPEQPGPCWAVTLLAPSPGEDGPAIAIQDVRSEGGERWVIRLVTPQGPHRITFQGAPRLTNVTYRDPLGHATGLEIP